ncbi:MAG: hypothetical protein SOV26_01210 [Candidatus Onthovivens sp.]|nr:hypothetical protein [Candidatus Onthovivens sp.]
MMEKYSNDDNYVSAIGNVIEFFENIAVIVTDDIPRFAGLEQYYYIYSCEIIELFSGDVIQYVTVPWYF